MTDPRLPVVSFTGSGAVGWRLREIAPRKRVGLELGGNAAVVVHSDADLDDAASRVAAGAFGYAGQSCISVQRALVQKDVFEAFRTKLLAKTAALAVGDPLDAKTDVGPMIAPEEAARAAAWIEEAVAGGAQVLAGGTRTGSVVLADDPRGHVARHEGRGAGSLRADRDALVLRHVGGGAPPRERLEVRPAGRRSSRTTSARIQRAFDVLEVGAVLVNDVPTWRADRMPYGGVKESGIGREGPAYAMEEFTEPRLLVLRP